MQQVGPAPKKKASTPLNFSGVGLSTLAPNPRLCSDRCHSQLKALGRIFPACGGIEL
jgi:hypothetical protein